MIIPLLRSIKSHCVEDACKELTDYHNLSLYL